MMELLLASTCSVMVMGGTLGLFITLLHLFNDGSAQMQLQSKVRYGIERIAVYVRAAESITLQSNGDRADISVPITNLRASVTSSASSLPVDSISFFPSRGVVTIGSENILFSGGTRPGDAQHPSLLSCTRGYGSTTAAAHIATEILHLKSTFYLSGNIIYLNTTGSPNTATDEVVISDVAKTAGVNLFQCYIPGSSSYRADRVQITFLCFKDLDGDHIRDSNEPGVNFSTELFRRN